MIFSNLNNLNAVRLRSISLENDNFLILLRLYTLSCASIYHYIINVPSIDHVPSDLFGVLEAEIDFKAGPIIEDTVISHIVSTMENDLVGERRISTDLRVRLDGEQE